MAELFQTVYEKANLLTALSGVVEFIVPENGEIDTLDIWALNATNTTESLFNFLIDGVPQFSGSGRMAIDVNNQSASKTGLATAVTKGQKVQFDLEVVGAGGVNIPIFFQVGFTPSGGGGSVESASNVGGEIEVFKQKSGTDLEFRTVKAGTNIDVTQNTSDVEIAVTGLPFKEVVAASDESTAITTGTKLTFYASDDFTLTEVFAGLTGQSTSGIVTVDINKNGTSVLSTKITIDQDEDTSLTAAVPPVIDGAQDDFVKGDKITIDVDTAGTNATGLKVYLKGTM